MLSLTAWKARRTIRELLQSTEPFLAGFLLPSIVDHYPQDAADTAGRLRDLLGTMSPREWEREGEKTRRDYSGWNEPVLRKLLCAPDYWKETGFPALRRLGRDGADVIGIVSLAPSGYVREAAVAELDQWNGGEEIPFLLLRLNDWVPGVREKAKAAVLRRLTPHSLRSLLLHVSQVESLRRGRRANNLDVVERFEQLLARTDLQEQLVEMIRERDEPVRVKLLRTLFRIPHTSASVVRMGLKERSALVRCWALEAAARRTDLADFKREIRHLVTDRSPAVRRLALEAAFSLGLGGLDPILETSVLSRSAGLRRVARKLLDATCRRDWAEFYRVRLGGVAGADCVALLGGLGETGGPEDRQRVRSFLQSNLASVRRAALAALSSLSREDEQDEFFAALSDPVRSVAKAARLALLARAEGVAPDRIRREFMSSSAGEVRKHLIIVLRHIKPGRWTRLRVLLQLLPAAQDEGEAARLIELLCAWIQRFNLSFTSIPAQERTALDEAFSGAEHLMPEVMSAAIGQCIEAAGGK